MASAMMWATRLVLASLAKNCSPAICWPAKVSHSRYWARMRPSASLPTLPVTSACALITFQSSKRGVASGPDIFSMKALLSIGANRPDRFRSAVTISVICAPSASLDWKSVMAIGSGSTLPLLTLSSTRAQACKVAAAVMPTAIAAIVRSGLRKDLMSSRFSSLMVQTQGLEAKHLPWIERDPDVVPDVLLSGGNLQAGHVAFLNRAHGAFVELPVAARLFDRWAAIELAVRVEIEPDHDDEVLRTFQSD